MSNDEHIWTDYAKGVKRIDKKKPAAKKPTLARTVLPKTSDLKPNVSAKSGWIPASAGMTEGLLDKRMERKLRAGELIIEAKLDMHGLTQKEAHAALGEFISKQMSRGARNLLIITGKGRDGGGVLKANFKTWLGNLPDAARILAVRPAAIKHGGAGAFYVILRKPSPPKGERGFYYAL